MGYRPELDGLRAVAVAMVVAAHYLGWAGAGRGGVTLFFVLSGFLITTLIGEELAETGRLDVRAFLSRRARRLVPALAFLLAVVGLVALMSAARAQLPGLLLAATYLGNWADHLGVEMGVLGHMWSLGIEEQFYLALPAAIVGMRMAPRATAVAAGAAAVLVVLTNQPGFSAILVGCALAQLRWSRVTGVPGIAAAVAAIAVMGFSGIDAQWGWSLPVFALTAAACAVVVDWAVRREPRVLGVRPLVNVGRISYGIYLWHLPVGLLLHEPLLAAGVPAAASLFALVGLTLVIASISYRFVERPFMRRFAGRRLSPPGGSQPIAPVLAASSPRRWRPQPSDQV